MRRSFLHGILVYLAAGMLFIALLIRIFFPPFIQMKKIEPLADLTSAQLFDLIDAAPAGSMNYLDGQIIQIKGTIQSLESNLLIIGTGEQQIRCKFRRTIYDRKPSLVTGETVVVKGVCQKIIGKEVHVNQCVVVAEWENHSAGGASLPDQ